jgi:hypothetical protein
MVKHQPEFPIVVTFQEDGDKWVLESADELACSLEWFDSEDPEERAVVVDAKNRPVRLRVEKLKLISLELK